MSPTVICTRHNDVYVVIIKYINYIGMYLSYNSQLDNHLEKPSLNLCASLSHINLPSTIIIYSLSIYLINKWSIGYILNDCASSIVLWAIFYRYLY
jgi:hypothetical protein